MSNLLQQRLVIAPNYQTIILLCLFFHLINVKLISNNCYLIENNSFGAVKYD